MPLFPTESLLSFCCLFAFAAATASFRQQLRPTNQQSPKSLDSFPKLKGYAGCSLKHLTNSNKLRTKFEKKYRFRKPVLIKKLTTAWPATSNWATREGFLKAHGDLEIVLREQLVRDTDNPLGEFENTMNVTQYLGPCSSDHRCDLIQFTFEDLKTFRQLAPEYASGSPALMPEMLRKMHKKPGFSLGRNGTGSGLHTHGEAWLAQMAGRKVWLVAPPMGNSMEAAGSVLPCDLLNDVVTGRYKLLNSDFSSTSVDLCTVNPGEVIYVPPRWHHATCNLDDFTLGVGGREDSSNWPAIIHYIQAGDEDGVRNELDRIGQVVGLGRSYNSNVEEVRQLNDPSLLDPLPMHLAARVGPIAILDLLVESGLVNPSTRDPKGFQPVHHAAYAGSVEVLQYLIAGQGRNSHSIGGGGVKVKPLAGLHDEGSSKLAALDLAAMGGHVEAVGWLLDEMKRQESGESTVVDGISSSASDGTECKAGGETKKKPQTESHAHLQARPQDALKVAADFGHLGLVKYLVEERGADPSAVADSGGHHEAVTRYVREVQAAKRLAARHPPTSRGDA